MKEESSKLTKKLDDMKKKIYIQMGISIYDVSAGNKASLPREYPEQAGDYIVIYI